MTDPLKPLIVFDAVGTLIRPNRSVADIYFEFGQRFGSKMSPSEIGIRFHQARDHVFVDRDVNPKTGVSSSEAIEREAWHQLVRFVFDDVDDPSRLFQQLWTYFARSDAWTVFEDVTECLEALARRNQSWLIASNFDGRLLSICRQLSQLADAVAVMVSSQIGFQKPDKRFFEAIQDRFGLLGDQLLMVGDRPDHDFDGALQAGWRAILLNRTSTESDASTICSLDELPFRVDQVFGP